ncbi:MAG: DUF4445 domain-containing protein [Lachnospiraceae bacterium]|nr:DUF4445 domain-containing protein [Lachnospiraceae bacterium]
MNEKQFEQHAIGAAVDLGSTTVAVCCMDLETAEELVSFSFSNPQTVYGADVITRIRHCVEDEHKLTVMGQMIRDTLWEQLKAHLGIQCGNVARIVYSGNTTMLHILRGMSVNGLAAAPFTPVSLEYAEGTEEKPHSESCTVSESGCMLPRTESGCYTAIYPPGFSAFAGADILTGAVFLGMGRSAAYELLVDLGTNGELLLVNQDYGYAASTACGPVFDHAVTGAKYGSESIRAIAGCVKRGLIDDTGMLQAPFFEKGITIDKGFVIRQQHIRNFQLAKGAIYAGIICLMTKAGITFEDISHLYVSGGLGFYMNIRDAFTVKMLPEELAGRITVSGNSSLEGAKQLLLAEENQQTTIRMEYENIRKRTMSFELADFDGFQQIYMESLNF